MATAVPTDAARGEAARSGPTVSYVDWPAIFAGISLAVALAFVLMTFGSAIGLGVASFEPGEGASLRWLGIASGIWLIWVAISSFAAGGYLAGRLRRAIPGASVDESETRDGAHGVVVWAAGTLVAAVLAANGVAGVVGAAGSAVGTAAQSATEAISDQLDYFGTRLTGGEEGSQAATQVIRRGLDGDLSAEDRDYLTRLVADRAGIPPEEASSRIDATMSQAREIYKEAVDTAEQARVAAAIAAFVVAATMFVSAGAAYFAAVSGGDHRDRNMPFRTFGRS